MKNLYILYLSVFILLISCTQDNKIKEEFREFKEFVKSQRDSAAVQSDDDWDRIERNYQEKKARLEKNVDKMDDKMKEELRSLDQEFEEAKEKFKAGRNKGADNDTAGSSLMPDDRERIYKNMNAADLVNSYVDFIRMIERDKEKYSRAQWEYVEKLWEALETRKDEIRSSLSQTDLIKIASQKVQYITIKANYKPGSLVESKDTAV